MKWECYFKYMINFLTFLYNFYFCYLLQTKLGLTSINNNKINSNNVMLFLYNKYHIYMHQCQ